ncbi:flavodoxin family protein [Bullifex porci]|uniref:flavodoxin family protein n=1 Tax=Bullifex porci TaxID=2606638 RepID=UPI0023F0CBFC|nr:flavodoxin family protein [Bullifex porci]MDD7589446.1 flavodoxin family protein [Bullifex porci]
MRCNIIIHSVSGNIYIIASYLQDKLIEAGIDARLYRVEDSDLHILAAKKDSVNQYLEDILELSVANEETLEKADMIILGAPTRFGGMTAEMKAFLDSTYDMCESRSLEGRLFGCFTSCAHSICEGSHALDSMLYWAQNMALLHIPYGVHPEVRLSNQPVAGIVHLEGRDNEIRPSDKLGDVINKYVESIIRYKN